MSRWSAVANEGLHPGDADLLVLVQEQKGDTAESSSLSVTEMNWGTTDHCSDQT